VRESRKAVGEGKTVRESSERESRVRVSNERESIK
jgi:hypothetical protein